MLKCHQLILLMLRATAVPLVISSIGVRVYLYVVVAPNQLVGLGKCRSSSCCETSGPFQVDSRLSMGMKGLAAFDDVVRGL